MSNEDLIEVYQLMAYKDEELQGGKKRMATPISKSNDKCFTLIASI